MWGQGTAEAAAWVAARKQERWEGRVEAVLAAVQQAAGEPSGAAAADELGSFAANTERMRSAHFRAQGCPIGSGTVESAGTRLIGARVKHAGMCWSQGGAQTVLSLRAALLSGTWEGAWAATRSARKAA